MTPDPYEEGGAGGRVPENVILRAVVGSPAHGLALEGHDDRDEMGVFIAPPERVLGFHVVEHHIERTRPQGVRSGPGDLDLTLYELRKYLRLALRGNPSILLLLFAEPLEATWTGMNLLDQAHRFCSKEAGYRFLGYLHAQRQRLTGERGQKNVKRPELVEQFGYDTKYAMHMLRLGLQGIEFMRTGRITLPMPEKERSALMVVRRGEMTEQGALTWAGALEAELRDEIDMADLPKKADHRPIERWMLRAYRETWGWE